MIFRLEPTARSGRIGRMKAHNVVLPLLLVACGIPGHAQKTHETTPNKAQRRMVRHHSAPLTWVVSDMNPKSTMFWIQGRFVPVGDANYKGDPEVATILCSVREQECIEIDSTNPFAHSVQAWIEDFKAISWDKKGILATARSLDGCTDETLRVSFSPPSVVLINSPVLPMSGNCKRYNETTDKIMGKNGWTIKAQMEQDRLVPTRSPFPWSDMVINSGTQPAPVPKKKP